MTKKVKEQLMDYMASSKKKSFSIEQLAEGLGLQKSPDFKQLVQTVAQMERENLVVFNKKGKIKLNETNTTLEGTFRANERGFGFVSIEGEDDDVFISRDDTLYALEGDTVEINIKKSGNPLEGQGPEGEVLRIVTRNNSQLVGIFALFSEEERQAGDLIGVVTPKDKKLSRFKLFVTDEGIIPEDGSVVVAEIKHYPSPGYTNSFEGMVKQVVGHRNDPGMDILSIVLQHGIPVEFEEETLREAESLPDTVLEKDLVGRRDLRDQVIVTIDGAEAKDLDDAVSVKRLKNGNFFLGVYIADVTHYVTENSAIDKEAVDRATSVYLTDRVIPMLPRKLSNGICSLNPDVDRLVMACEMEITTDGDVVYSDIFKGVIHSKARMTYDAVNDIIERSNEDTLETYKELIPLFDEMAVLHDILEEKRSQRGAISFESREAYIVVDAEGHPIDIKLRTRKVAERLIESFMLVANETVARTYTRKKLPFVYRIHEHPKEEKVQRFFEFMTTFGIVIKGQKDDVSPKELQRVLEEISGRPEEPVVSMMLLRSMQQARYSEDPVGHYGLAASDYTHFTSPIRRYPDLLVHRLIKEYEAEPVAEATKEKWNERIPDIADHSSKMERRAVDAERDTDSLKKAEFMQDKIDLEFDGFITSITKFGMFVELDNTVEGLIHMTQLKQDYFHFIESHMALVGERTGTVYKIGQPVRIKVTKADVDTREIDFELISAEPLPDVIEIPKKDLKSRSGKPNHNRGNKEKRPHDKGVGKKGVTSKNKGNKPFYKGAKKAGKKKK